MIDGARCHSRIETFCRGTILSKCILVRRYFEQVNNTFQQMKYFLDSRSRTIISIFTNYKSNLSGTYQNGKYMTNSRVGNVTTAREIYSYDNFLNFSSNYNTSKHTPKNMLSMSFNICIFRTLIIQENTRFL